LLVTLGSGERNVEATDNRLSPRMRAILIFRMKTPVNISISVSSRK
jgi:hypothetical protein